LDEQMNLVLDDTIRIPIEFAHDFAAFRRWTKSDGYPDRGEYAFLNGEVWVDLSMETWIHNQVKTQIAAVLTLLVQAQNLGRFCGDRMRLVHEKAGLSDEPDAMFISHEGLRRGRVRIEEGPQSQEVIGTPEMVLEVVSKHSIQKDTVVLRELYAVAGISEYWLVNPLGEALSFDILRLTARGYVTTRKSDGWIKSALFGKSFRLEAQQSRDDLPEYRLLVR
jgi:Uma2 family endonuclease